MYHKWRFDKLKTEEKLREFCPMDSASDTSPRPSDYSIAFRKLTETFPTLDREIVKAVYQKCHFDQMKTEEKLREFCAIDPASAARRGDLLGEGQSGVVRRDHDEKYHLDVAIKPLVLDRTSPSYERDLWYASQEIEHLELLKSDHIVRLERKAEETPEGFILSMQLCGFSLRRCISHLLTDSATFVPFARKFMHDMVNALKCMHTLGIAHRDLKPDNVLLHYNVAEREVERGETAKLHFVVCDLGLSRRQGGGDAQSMDVPAPDVRTGTQEYMAPELFESSGMELDLKPCDIWSLGVILVEILTGSHYAGPAISAQALPEYLSKFEFADVDDGVRTKLTVVSREGYELATKMMARDPKKRITLDGICAHPFMRPTTPPPP